MYNCAICIDLGQVRHRCRRNQRNAPYVWRPRLKGRDEIEKLIGPIEEYAIDRASGHGPEASGQATPGDGPKARRIDIESYFLVFGSTGEAPRVSQFPPE